MDISKIIQKRRTIYPVNYTQKKISKSFIKLLLKNANTAPSHKLTQPWFFKVYSGDSKDLLANEMVKAHYKLGGSSKAMDLKKRKIIDKCHKSNCIISIFMKRDKENSVPEWEEIAATSMAVQNMWLTCTAHNIGCYWSTPKYSYKMKKFFNLKNDERNLGFFYIGKYDSTKIKKKQRVPVNEKTEWNN